VTCTGADKVTIVCSIEGELTAIVNQIDLNRYAIKKDETSKAAERKVSSDDDMSDLDGYDENKAANDSDNDSIFGDENGDKFTSTPCYIEDKTKNDRKIMAGSKVKLTLTDV